jgi:hypothetical protein
MEMSSVLDARFTWFALSVHNAPLGSVYQTPRFSVNWVLPSGNNL